MFLAQSNIHTLETNSSAFIIISHRLIEYDDLLDHHFHHILIYISFPPSNIKLNEKYVFISSCDTGFGHELALTTMS